MLAAKAFEGNPYDTLAATVDQAVEIGVVDPDCIYVGQGISRPRLMPARDRLLIAGRKRGLTANIDARQWPRRKPWVHGLPEKRDVGLTRPHFKQRDNAIPSSATYAELRVNCRLGPGSAASDNMNQLSQRPTLTVGFVESETRSCHICTFKPLNNRRKTLSWVFLRSWHDS